MQSCPPTPPCLPSSTRPRVHTNPAPPSPLPPPTRVAWMPSVQVVSQAPPAYAPLFKPGAAALAAAPAAEAAAAMPMQAQQAQQAQADNAVDAVEEPEDAVPRHR